MCGIVGFCNLTKEIKNKKNVLTEMNNTLSKRGPDESNLYIENNIALGHNRLIVVDPNGGKQPMTFKYNNEIYTIVYNGQIYNCDELKKDLLSKNIQLDTHSDTEILLKSFAVFGKEILNKLNGIYAFAIWCEKKKELFLARDHFGVKPLYYTITNDSFIFASEVKAILKYPNVQTILDENGIKELFGIFPAHTAGTTIFKNINELYPASYAIYNKYGLYIEEYWKLESKPHLDNFDTTCNKVKYLLEDCIKRQLISDVPLCTFLSGGLDSSIITRYASDEYKNKNLGVLSTYSVNYVDNNKNFIKSDFQSTLDDEYIKMLTYDFGTSHTDIYIDTPELIEALNDSMIARDFPGMADIDSSLLLFCKYVKNNHTVAISGECSDEIFAGYPWFFREDSLSSNTFPWSLAIKERQQLLNSSLKNKIYLKEYIDSKYTESLSNVKTLDCDSKDTAEKRKISYLTINWFMQTLLDRSDKMSMYNGLELRVPFCDYRLAEYVYNIPWDYKAFNNREKGLLRYIVKDILPPCIVDRKKSPYPKTFNPNYFNSIKDKISKIIKNNNSPINDLIDISFVEKILNTDKEIFSTPWFGQLMTTPQLLAYLYQINMWLEHYKPTIQI